MQVVGISGSLREHSFNTAALRAIQSFELIELVTYTLTPIPLFNEDLEQHALPPSVQQLRDLIIQTKALIIACPEYNWSIPGVLKNAIDWLSSNKINCFSNVSIGVIGASNGRFGTARAQMHLKTILFHLGARVMNSPDLFIAKAQDVFDTSLTLTDTELKKRLYTFTQAFVTFASM